MAEQLPRDGYVATVNPMLAGYAYSLGRPEEALSKRDGAGGFRAIFEALNWAHAIDERIAQHWAPEGKPLAWRSRQRVSGADLMAGVRFVRNRVHHQWAYALRLDAEGGGTFPLRSPVAFTAWRWRTLEERASPLTYLTRLLGTTCERGVRPHMDDRVAMPMRVRGG